MFLAGGGAAGIASLIANPMDVLKTRMQADPGSRSFIAHAGEVYKGGGVINFWRGASACVGRAVIIGAVKLATYDKSKMALEDYAGLKRGSIPNLVGASLVTGANVIFWSTPADVIKTKVMTSNSSASMIKTMTDIIKEGGPMAFWRGWFPAYARVAPYTVISFVAMEKIAKALGSSMT